MFTKMKITLNLNPNHIEFIQYKLDSENSLRFTFDTESSDTTPAITLVSSQSKIKLEKDKQEQKVVVMKKHFQDILKKADSVALDKKSLSSFLDITPLDLPPIVNNTFNELKSEDKEQSKWVNSNSPEAMKLCGKKSRPSQRFEEQVAEKYKKLDNEYYNSK